MFPGVLTDHARVYSLVSIGGLKSGRANLVTREVAALAARPMRGQSIRGVLFDIPQEEFAPYVEREHRYRIEQRPVIQWTGSESIEGDIINAFICLEQTDEEYLASLSGGSDEWHDRVGKYYPAEDGGEGGRLWGRRDILPMTNYMADVIVAASTLGKEWLEDAVDNTFMVDGKTSLRIYVRDRLTSGDSDMLRQALVERSLKLPATEGEGRPGSGNTLLDYMVQEK